MLTRGGVRHQYGTYRADYSPPPFHVTMRPAQYPYEETRGERAYSRVAPFIPLNMHGPAGVRRGITSPYDAGYLGMDPMDPSSWVRPLNIAPGMIGRLNGAVK
jgi:hypothetical protein